MKPIFCKNCIVWYRVLPAILLALTFVVAGTLSYADKAEKPVVLIFDVNGEDNVSSTNIDIATRALRDYLRQSGRVEATIFNRKSPIVARAIMEKKISPEKLTTYDDRKVRAEVAKALGMEYACGAQIKIEQLKVRMAMWVLNVDKPKQSWEIRDYVAESGRMDDNGIRNAIHSVCSAMVNEIVRDAFTNLPVTEVVELPDEEVTQVAPVSQPDPQANASDLKNSAEINLTQGNTARAVDLYTKAINANPTDYDLRIRLAEIYHKRGMYQEANDELQRAIDVGADSDLIAAAKERIFKNAAQVMEIDHPEPPKPSTDPTKPTGTQQPVRTNPQPSRTASANSSGVDAGDKLWNAGDAMGAEEAYVNAARKDSKDWRAYERLAILLASQYRFSESRDILAQLNIVQPVPSDDVLRLRYRWLSLVLDHGVNAMLADMDSSIANFESRRVSRESSYEEIKFLRGQMQSLILYADELIYPPEMRQANANRVQSCRLGMQAASALMEYLETDEGKFKANAAVFMEQAKIELEEIK